MFSKLWRSLVVIILVSFPSSFSFAAGPQSSPEDKWQYTNHLINETSPYLLQHAHNPVEWYPWDEEAFAKARKENKSIFLSIGYSTCHWCHVMERESYSDPEIAANHERQLCQHQSRPRRTPGCRQYLHDLRPGDYRQWRLAYERLADAGSQTFCWRDLFPCEGAARPALFQNCAFTGCRGLEK